MSPQTVLIVGAGPVGLVSAIILLKNGVSVRVIEKEKTYHQSSRGNGVMPRIQELEYFLGTLPDLLKFSISSVSLKHYDPTDPHRVARSVDMLEQVEATPASPINKPVMVSQYLHEQVLRDHLEALGGRIELGVELQSIHQDGESVTAKLLKHSEGGSQLESATFPYVIGADGGKSTVRKMVSVNFIGETHETDKLLNSDIDLQTPLEGKGFHAFGDERSLSAVFRTTNDPHRYQLLVIGPKYWEIADECSKADMKELQAIITKITGRPDLVITKLHFKANWQLNVRMVENFQVGRVFVIGDAAHVHSPMGGQGMTTGIQDAFNLAWKLALAVKGLASPSLLASYEEERLPVVAAMLLETTQLHQKVYYAKEGSAETQNMQSTIDALGRAAAPAAATDETVSLAQEDEPLFRGRKLFQLGVNYRWSSIVRDDRATVNEGGEQHAYGKDGENVRAGDRAPDAPGLDIVFKGPGVDATSEKLKGRGEGPIRLFDIFNPTAHTVLVFSRQSDFVHKTQDVLRRLLNGVAQTVGLSPSAAAPTPASSTESRNVDLSLFDKNGHAYRGYGVDEGSDCIVAVRPDGFIGAYVHTPDKVGEYFANIITS